MADNFESELETKIANAQSDDEVLRLFAEAGYSVTREQLDMESNDDELGEDMLDMVSGGGVLSWIRRAINQYNAKKNASNYNGGGGGFSRGGGGGHSFGGGGSGGGGGR